MLRLLVLGAVIFSVTGNVSAQSRRPEFFEIVNLGQREIAVSLRARGGGVRGWQTPVDIPPDHFARIPLQGYEPFDITIRELGGTSYVFSQVKLCTFIQQCAIYGQQPWRLTARVWQKTISGGRVFDRDTGQLKTFYGTADIDTVRMTFGLYHVMQPGHGESPGQGETLYPGKNPAPPMPPPGGPRR